MTKLDRLDLAYTQVSDLSPLTALRKGAGVLIT